MALLDSISVYIGPSPRWGGWVERRCWVNFQCQGVLLVWMIVGQGPIALAVGAGGGCLDIFSLIYLFSFLSPSLWETARYRLKYCLKGPLNPKQPTNQPSPRKRGGDGAMVLGQLPVPGRPTYFRDGRVVRWCWVNVQCRGVLQFG